MSQTLPWLDADTVASSLPFPDAIDALERALADGLDPTGDPGRTIVEIDRGQLLLMPAQTGDGVGVKIITSAPDNPAAGLPRIQGIYLLCDAQTLAPVALLDGAELTLRRTPAVSALGARLLAAPDAERLVVFGTGPQAWAHIEALRGVRPWTDLVVVGRDAERTRRLTHRAADAGMPARTGDARSVSEADVVVCTTSASEPLFPGDAVPDTACVIAMGSHEPHARELDGTLLGRASVVVEDRATALREAGDVILAVSEGALRAEDLINLADVVTGRVEVDPATPRVFKTVGMAWQDLVVAAATYRNHLAGQGT